MPLIDLNGLGHFKAKENAMVADTYSASKTYAVGDYVYYNGTLYRCTTAISTAEAWTAGHWTAVKLADDCSALKTALTVLEPTATSSDVGKALIAKTVADGKVTEYEFGEAGGGGSGLSSQAKTALLQLLSIAVYNDDNAVQYYQNLYDALKSLESISAVYTQSGTVYTTDSLDSLKSDLVVTAIYEDESTKIVPSTDYTLSGNLTSGTATITVTYSGKTTTFNVTVTRVAGTFTVTNTLTGCVNSNTSSAVTEESSYSGTITPSSGYTLTGATVSITMGNSDITSTAYNNGVISIASVTGDIVIAITAVQVPDETLTIRCVSSYPNQTTGEDAADAEYNPNTSQYTMSGLSTYQGGTLEIDYTPSIYDNFNVNIYGYKNGIYVGYAKFGNSEVIAWDGTHKLTDSEFSTTHSGFGFVHTSDGKAKVIIPDDYTVKLCFRKGNDSTGTGYNGGSVRNGNFAGYTLSSGFSAKITH